MIKCLSIQHYRISTGEWIIRCFTSIHHIESVTCKFCDKMFFNTVLENQHMRMNHMLLYMHIYFLILSFWNYSNHSTILNTINVKDSFMGKRNLFPNLQNYYNFNSIQLNWIQESRSSEDIVLQSEMDNKVDSMQNILRSFLGHQPTTFSVMLFWWHYVGLITIHETFKTRVWVCKSAPVKTLNFIGH